MQSLYLILSKYEIKTRESKAIILPRAELHDEISKSRCHMARAERLKLICLKQIKGQSELNNICKHIQGCWKYLADGRG